MDALAGIGHACGHNLIAIAGVAIACAIRAAIDAFNIDGHIVLLGTPGEEGGMGKLKLLDMGAYDGMDVCLMYVLILNNFLECYSSLRKRFWTGVTRVLDLNRPYV